MLGLTLAGGPLDAAGAAIDGPAVGADVSGDSLNAIANGDRVGSALQRDVFHLAPAWADTGDIAVYGQEFSVTGADGVTRTLVQSPASVNGVAGRFEWIINPDETISHEFFVAGGGINGVPIKP
jgi:hypothetical protein